jgi:hypothetical protein
VEVDEATWQDLLQVAQRHEVAPLVSRGLAASRTTAPAAVVETLRQNARVSEVRNARAWDQLGEAVSALNARGIQPLLLKGALFSLRYYASPGLRPFSDLDLLVLPQDRERAAEALAGLGYAPYQARNDHDPAWYEENHYHWGFAREKGLRLELHWALTPPCSQARLDPEALWERSLAVECPGGRGRGLALEDEIVHLAVHAAKHQFLAPLRQYVDLAAILEKGAAPDWDMVWERAQEAGAGMDLAIYLGIAGELGLVILPEHVLWRARAITARHADLALLARYAVEWPYVERPLGVIDMLAAPSVGAAMQRVREAMFPSKRHAAAAGEESASPRASTPRAQWLARIQRLSGKRQRLGDDAPSLRAAVMIRRLFRNREAP